MKAAWDPDDTARAVQAWEDGGYRARIAGSAAQPPERVAEAVVFAVTRPEGSMVDIMYVRAQS
jgi:NADP-dependent 3-hydroxy acid dehydrogenase YdfG